MATLWWSFASGELPLSEAGDLPAAYPKGVDAKKGSEAFLPELQKAMIEKFNVIPLNHFANTAQQIYCKDAMPDGIRSLKGRKIRTVGAALSQMFKAFGAEPVQVPFAEVYTALERGVLDCARTGTTSGNNARWHEVTAYHYDLPRVGRWQLRI